MREQMKIVMNGRKRFNAGEAEILFCNVILGPIAQDPVAQSVASLTADPGIMRLIPARSHNFVEIDHETIATIILLLLIQEGLSVTNTGMCMK